MRDVTVELKALRLHGMASAWCDLAEQGAALTAWMPLAGWSSTCCRRRPQTVRCVRSSTR